MKAAEFRKRSPEELRSALGEALVRKDALQLTLQQKKAKNVKELRFVKKDIARIHTLLREKDL